MAPGDTDWGVRHSLKLSLTGVQLPLLHVRGKRRVGHDYDALAVALDGEAHHTLDGDLDGLGALVTVIQKQDCIATPVPGQPRPVRAEAHPWLAGQRLRDLPDGLAGAGIDELDEVLPSDRQACLIRRERH